MPAINKRRALIAAGAAALIVLCYALWAVFAPLRSDQIAFRVSLGDGAGQIARELRDRGIVRSGFWFRLLASARGTDRRLKAGTYSLGGDKSLYQTLLMLERGNTQAIRITFPEGLSLYKTLRRIEDSGLATYAELHAAATDTSLVRQLTGFAVASMEGFLYPETYFFDLGLTPVEILSRMTEQFHQELEQAGIRAQDIPGFYEKLTLAAIVEKESAHPDERGLIAGVMYNRLRKGMRLACCTTVDYVLERRGTKKPVLSLDDTKIASPYNTYLNEGLPPGPICNPSLGSLQAALHPVESDYLYFVADRKGRNDFSRTAQEHMSKSRAYKRAEWE